MNQLQSEILLQTVLDQVVADTSQPSSDGYQVILLALFELIQKHLDEVKKQEFYQLCKQGKGLEPILQFAHQHIENFDQLYEHCVLNTMADLTSKTIEQIDQHLEQGN